MARGRSLGVRVWVVEAAPVAPEEGEAPRNYEGSPRISTRISKGFPLDFFRISHDFLGFVTGFY